MQRQRRVSGESDKKWGWVLKVFVKVFFFCLTINVVCLTQVD